MIAIRKLSLPAAILALLILAGCAGLTLKSPSVTLADIKIIEAGLLEQRFAFKLRIQNPNNVEIAIAGLSFDVEINGRPFAKGVSNRATTIPRLGEKILEVTAVSNIYSLLGQVEEFIAGKNKVLTYRISGRLVTDLAGEIHFEKSGNLGMTKPEQDQGKIIL